MRSSNISVNQPGGLPIVTKAKEQLMGSEICLSIMIKYDVCVQEQGDLARREMTIYICFFLLFKKDVRIFHKMNI